MPATPPINRIRVISYVRTRPWVGIPTATITAHMSPAAFRLYCWLVAQAYWQHPYRPREAARQLRATLRSIKRWMKELEHAGYITSDKHRISLAPIIARH